VPADLLENKTSTFDDRDMRVALISDLHANEVALKAVLSDIDRTGVDQIVCLGDVATLGPRPSYVIEVLERLGCICIEGNHDAFLLDGQLTRTYNEPPIVIDAVDWCQARLSSAETAFIKTFKSKAEIPLEGNLNLLVFHGSPRSYMEDLLATTPPEALDSALNGATSAVLAGGHTHIQMVRQHRGMLLVNPGSVGLPFKEYVHGREPTLLKHSEYAVVESNRGSVSINLRRVQVDFHEACKHARESDNPIAPGLLRQWS
jgi:putative phosphoesterase